MIENDVSVVEYPGTGATNTWPFQFLVYGADNVAVYTRDSATSEWERVNNPNIVLGVGSPRDGYAGGSVIRAVPVGQQIKIERTSPFTQKGIILNAASGFDPKAVEREFDRSVMRDQELRREMETVGSAAVLQSSENAALAESARVAAEASAEEAAASVGQAEAAAEDAKGAFAAWQVDTFTGDGTEDTFTLTTTPGGQDSVFVSIDGLVERDFTLVGTDVIFDTPPSEDAEIVAQYGFITYTAPPGPQGEPGTGISIAGSVATVGALPNDLTEDDAGDAYFVEENGDLYIWDGSTFPATGVEFRGPAGYPGTEEEFHLAGDARYARKDLNLNDLPNKALALQNLGGAPITQTADDFTTGRATAMRTAGIAGWAAATPLALQEAGAATLLSRTGIWRVVSAYSATVGMPYASSWLLMNLRYNETYTLQIGYDLPGKREFHRLITSGLAGTWDEKSTQKKSLADFGAQGGGADDTAALTAAFASGVPIYGVPGVTYRITGPVENGGAPVNFSGNGCSILCDGSDAEIYLTGGWGTEHAVSAISVGENSTTITLASGGSSYAPGDVIKIGSDDTLPAHSAGSTAGLRGEFLVVQSVSGNVLTVPGKLSYNYNTDPKIAKLSRTRIVLEDINISNPEPLGVPTTAWNELITIEAAYRPVIRDLTSRVAYNGALKLVSVKGGRVCGLTLDYGADKSEEPWASNSAVGIDGDGVELVNCQNTKIIDGDGQCCRHFVTMNSAQIGSSLSAYGTSMGNRGVNLTCDRATGSSFDFHEGAAGNQYIDCRSSFSKGYGFSVRGVRNYVIDCISDRDYRGIHFFKGSDYPDSIVQYNKASGLQIINPTRAAVVADDESGHCVLQDFSIQLIGGEPLGSVAYATAAATLFDIGASTTLYLNDFSLFLENIDATSMTSIVKNTGAASHTVVEGMRMTSRVASLFTTLVLAAESGNSRVILHDITARIAEGGTMEYLVKNGVAANSKIGDITVWGTVSGVNISNTYTNEALITDNTIDFPIRWGDEMIAPPGLGTGGGDESPVQSVNTQTGAVMLDYSDVGAAADTNPTIGGTINMPDLESGWIRQTEEKVLESIPGDVPGTASCLDIIANNLAGKAEQGAAIWRHSYRKTPLTPAAGGACTWLWPTDAEPNRTSIMYIENDAADEAALTLTLPNPENAAVANAYLGASGDVLELGLVVTNVGASGSFTVDIAETAEGEMPQVWTGSLTTITLDPGETVVCKAIVENGQVTWFLQTTSATATVPISVVDVNPAIPAGYNPPDLDVLTGHDVFAFGIVNNSSGTAMTRNAAYGLTSGFEFATSPLTAEGEAIFTTAGRRFCVGHLRVSSDGTLDTPGFDLAGVAASIALAGVDSVHSVVLTESATTAMPWGQANPLPPGSAAIIVGSANANPCPTPAGASVESTRNSTNSNALCFVADIDAWEPADHTFGGATNSATLTIFLIPQTA